MHYYTVLQKGLCSTYCIFRMGLKEVAKQAFKSPFVYSTFYWQNFVAFKHLKTDLFLFSGSMERNNNCRLMCEPLTVCMCITLRELLLTVPVLY